MLEDEFAVACLMAVELEAELVRRRSTASASRGSSITPSIFCALTGRDTTGLPLIDRKALLEPAVECILPPVIRCR